MYEVDIWYVTGEAGGGGGELCGKALITGVGVNVVLERYQHCDYPQYLVCPDIGWTFSMLRGEEREGGWGYVVEY